MFLSQMLKNSRLENNPFKSNLLNLQFSLSQIAQIQNSRKDNLNLECACNFSEILKDDPLCLDLNQITSILSKPHGYKAINEIIKYKEILKDVPSSSIIKAACQPLKEKGIESMVFYLNILRSKSPIYKNIESYAYKSEGRQQTICAILRNNQDLILAEQIEAWENQKLSDSISPPQKRQKTTQTSTEGSSFLNLHSHPKIPTEQMPPELRAGIAQFLQITNKLPVLTGLSNRFRSHDQSNNKPIFNSNLEPSLADPINNQISPKLSSINETLDWLDSDIAGSLQSSLDESQDWSVMNFNFFDLDGNEPLLPDPPETLPFYDEFPFPS